MKVTDEDKRRASAAYAEAVNSECPDGIQKDECWKCAQKVIAKHIAMARADEREACAKEADYFSSGSAPARSIAKNIRGRE